jgi:hypothetical protein
MRFNILRLRYKGRPIPSRELANRTPVVGDLRVECVFDDVLRRHVNFAKLMSFVRVIDPEDLPTLYDPTLVAMSPLAFTLAGFERVEGVDYAQSWMVTSL